VNGATTYAGTISSFTSCTGPAIAAPAKTSPAPDDVYTFTYPAPEPVPAPGPVPAAAPAPAPAPAPCPVYACPPRQACFLTRLFARRCHRSSCW
jgi:hypothetical protein